MEYRYGVKVPVEEVKDLIDEERSRDAVREQVLKEVKSLRRGEVLRFVSSQEVSWQSELGLSLFISSFGEGFKVFTKGKNTYVYREK